MGRGEGQARRRSMGQCVVRLMDLQRTRLLLHEFSLPSVTGRPKARTRRSGQSSLLQPERRSLYSRLGRRMSDGANRMQASNRHRGLTQRRNQRSYREKPKDPRKKSHLDTKRQNPGRPQQSQEHRRKWEPPKRTPLKREGVKRRFVSRDSLLHGRRI